MPPKKRSTAGAAASTKKLKAEASAKAAAAKKDAPLMEAQEALQQEPAAASRVLKRRNTNDEVERKIQSHFPGMTPTQMESKRVDGLTLRERIEKDTRDVRTKKGARLGAAYWRELQRLYAEAGSGPGELKVKNSNEIVSDALLSALQAAVNTNNSARTVEPLTMYLQNARSLNQKELVGLFKAISDTQAMGKENADIAMRECLKCILRNELDKTFAEELGCCRNFIDSCLCRQFLSLRKAGVKPQTWLDSNWSLARLLMEEADLQAVKHSAGNWKAVAMHVARLTASSSLGQALFGYAEQLVCSAIFEDRVEKDVAGLLTANVTAEKVRNVRVACEGYTGDLKRVAALKGLKRHVAISFLKQSVTITVMDFSLEVHLRLSAALKGLAIQQGQLQRLPYEDWLLPAAREPKIGIQEELLQDAAACRKLAVEMLQSESVNSLQDMAKILEKNSQALCSLDSSFKLELAFLNTAADGLLKATVTQKLLETLPNESRRRSLTQSLAAVQDLSQTQMMKMSPPALRTLAQSVEEILANMLRGSGPEASLAKSGDFYAKVMHHLGFFVWEGEGADATYAAPALKKKFHECQKKLQADPKSVSLGDLEIFQTYKFLLSSDDAEQLGKSVKQCLSAASAIVPAAKLPAKKPKDSDSKKSTSVAVMSYFG